MERLTKKIDFIKLQAQIYDYLVGELYPIPECDNCEYNFQRLSSGKCFRCDGASQFVLAKGIQADIRRMAKNIVLTVNNNRYEVPRRKKKKARYGWVITASEDSTQAPI